MTTVFSLPYEIRSWNEQGMIVNRTYTESWESSKEEFHREFYRVSGLSHVDVIYHDNEHDDLICVAKTDEPIPDVFR